MLHIKPAVVQKKKKRKAKKIQFLFSNTVDVYFIVCDAVCKWQMASSGAALVQRQK